MLHRQCDPAMRYFIEGEIVSVNQLSGFQYKRKLCPKYVKSIKEKEKFLRRT